MSKRSNRLNPPTVQSQIPVFCIDADEVEESYLAFAALRRAAQSEPELIENKYFTALQDTAYARFLMNFEAMQ
jgi:hypothetical protein